MIKTLLGRRFFFIYLSLAILAGLLAIINTKSNPQNGNNYSVNFISKNEFIFEKNINSDKKIETILIQDTAQDSRNTSLDTSGQSVIFGTQIKDINAYISGFSSPLAMAIDLQEKFDSDGINYEAANKSEKDLAYLFYQGSEWQEFSPREISCKTNICRVKLELTSDQKDSRILQLLSDAMTLKIIDYSFAIPVDLPVEGYRYIYFL